MNQAERPMIVEKAAHPNLCRSPTTGKIKVKKLRHVEKITDVVTSSGNIITL